MTAAIAVDARQQSKTKHKAVGQVVTMHSVSHNNITQHLILCESKLADTTKSTTFSFTGIYVPPSATIIDGKFVEEDLPGVAKKSAFDLRTGLIVTLKPIVSEIFQRSHHYIICLFSKSGELNMSILVLSQNVDKFCQFLFIIRQKTK